MMMERRLAIAFIRHARRVLPTSQAEWGAAMEQEARHIKGDQAALPWALGCVATSYGERLRAEHFLLPLLGRLYLACICIGFAIDGLAQQPYSLMQCHLFGNADLINPPFPLSLPFAPLFPSNGPLLCDYLMLGGPLWLSILGLVTPPLFLLAAFRLMQARASALPAFTLASLTGMLVESRHYWYTIMLPWMSQLRHALLGGSYHLVHTEMFHDALTDTLFYVLYPLIVGTCIAFLVRKNSERKASS